MKPSPSAGWTRALLGLLLPALFLLMSFGAMGASEPVVSSGWPQAYSVRQEHRPARLVLSNAYYRVEHDLTRGGAISRIQLHYGSTENLLVQPLGACIQDETGAIYNNLNDRSPRMQRSREGLSEVVTVESRLLDSRGVAAQGLRLKTRYEYHWGYIKVRQEWIVQPGATRFTELCVLNTVLAPNLTRYGFREGTTEENGASGFSFGSCRWGSTDAPNSRPELVQTNFVPRYVMFADAGREGLEWFVGSDLRQWNLQLTDQRRVSRFVATRQENPAGVKLSLSPYCASEPLTLSKACEFNFYLGLPLRGEHALKPWYHTSFNRNRGSWVSAEQIKKWADDGIQTVHCHNDGDYYGDGLFWRDGSYPPYPDMDKYDQVIRDCHAVGLRVATYFSNKELHPSTPEFQAHGAEWARTNRKGKPTHNFFQGTNEFGAQMCLRSGWLTGLESSIDRVLTQHPLDGVYYDWNVALLCYNHQHQGDADTTATAAHWDIDELLQLMEWTRQRVGPSGMIIIHNTTTPMFATENFADYIVANEWGYGKWTGQGPELTDLPLEWSLVGARARGVISYGQLDAKSPVRLKRVFALESLLGGVTPWPVSAEAEELFRVLKPIGAIETCRFQDWRNDAVKLRGTRCASAIYSRPGESYLVLANLGEAADEVQCQVYPGKLPHPLSTPRGATLIRSGAESTLDVQALVQGGLKISVPGDSAVLVRIQ